ncbi:MAG: DMT family transporter [Pseudomonadota bacterium]
MTNLEFVRRQITAKLPDDRNIRASLLLLCGISIASFMAVCIRFLGDDFSPFQIVFVRSCVMLSVLLPLLLKTGLSILHTDRPLMILTRAVSGFTGQIFGVLAIINLPLAEVQALSFSRAFMVALLSLFFLQEVITKLRWGAIFLGFAGVVIIADPQSGLNGFAFFALASAFCFSINTILIKILLATHSRQTLMTHAALFQCLFASIPTFFVFKMPQNGDWIWFVLMGAIALCVQPLNLAAYRMGEVSRLAPVEFTRLITATLIGFLVFQEVPSYMFWFGAVLIVGANLMVMNQKDPR